jgi:hypothetical protein
MQRGLVHTSASCLCCWSRAAPAACRRSAAACSPASRSCVWQPSSSSWVRSWDSDNCGQGDGEKPRGCPACPARRTSFPTRVPPPPNQPARHAGLTAGRRCQPPPGPASAPPPAARAAPRAACPPPRRTAAACPWGHWRCVKRQAPMRQAKHTPGVKHGKPACPCHTGWRPHHAGLHTCRKPCCLPRSPLPRLRLGLLHLLVGQVPHRIHLAPAVSHAPHVGQVGSAGCHCATPVIH